MADRQAAEQFDGFVDVGNRPDVEAAGAAGLDHGAFQHEVFDVVGRDQHALFAVEAARGADVEEAFDLFVDAADGLHAAVLIDRAGDGE